VDECCNEKRRKPQSAAAEFLYISGIA